MRRCAFLGYNPLRTLVGDRTLAQLPASDRSTLTGHSFFPTLISQPFHHGLVIVFTAAIAMSLIGAAASLLRGTRYIHGEVPGSTAAEHPPRRFPVAPAEALEGE